MGPRAVGFLFDALMRSLGSGRSIVHGGDRGAHITSLLGSHRPDRVAGTHPTGIAPCDTTAAQLTGEGAEDATEEEKSFVADPEVAAGGRLLAAARHQASHARLGHGRQPVGSAGWIIEAFHAWSDLRDVPFEDRYRPEQLPTEVLLYLPARPPTRKTTPCFKRA